jgi:hypothetical protein
MKQLWFYLIMMMAMIISNLLPVSFATENNSENNLVNRCDVSAFITDKDPKGLNVRSAPNKNVISRIPYKSYQPEQPITVHIVDVKTGWLKIDRWTDGLTTGKFAGDAWVYSKLVAVSVKGDENIKVYGGPEGATTRLVAGIHEKPSVTTPLLGQLDAENQLVNILDCQGQWILTEGKQLDGKKLKGWLAPQKHCPNLAAICVMN